MKSKTLRLFAAGTLFLICQLSIVALAQVPNIDTFTPLTGPVGTQVTITGSNFDPTPGNNEVYFGSVKAVVSSASGTQLTVTVPDGSTYHPITVITNESVAVSKVPFTVSFESSRFFDENSFDNSVDFLSGSNPTSLVIGDFDNDGNPDIAVINSGGNTVSVLRNISTGNTIAFEEKIDFDAGPDINSLAFGDLDGDGKLDLVVSNDFSNSTVSVLQNISTGAGNINFSARKTFIVNPFPRSVSLGDFNTDGKLDILVGSGDYKGFSILENISGSGVIDFNEKLDFPTFYYIDGIGVGDFNDDDKVDFAIATASTNKGLVLENTSTGVDNFSFSSSILTIGNYTSYSAFKRVVVGDIDMDSKPDLVVSTPGGNTISVLRNTSDGAISFAGGINFETGTLPYSVLIADLNGDTTPDIATANRNGNTLSIFKNLGSESGTIDLEEGYVFDLGYTTNDFPWYLAASDMNSDEKPDLVLSVNREDKISVFRNINEQRSDSELLNFSVAGETGAAIIDVNNLTVTLEVTYGTDITSLVPEFNISNGATASVGTVLQESGVSIVDFTNPVTYTVVAEDGVTTKNWEVTISVGPASQETDFLSYGFKSQTSLTTIDVVNHVITLEVSRFVLIEELIANFSLSKGATATIAGIPQISEVTINNFSSAITYSVLAEDEITTQDWQITVLYDQSTKIVSFEPKSGPAGTTVNITAENFSFDATLLNNKVHFGGAEAEIVSATTEQLSVIVPPGSFYAPVTVTTNGLQAFSLEPFKYTFSAATKGFDANSFDADLILPAGLYAIDVATGDLNEDGFADIIVANNNNSSISIYKNLTQEIGQITFDEKVDMSIGNSPTSVTIGDINVDGKLDVVVTAGSVFVLINNSTPGGEISFLAPASFDGGNNTRSVRIGDIDGDGLPDIVCAVSGGGGFSVLRNTSNGSLSFAPKVSFSSGTRPWGIGLGDLDGDGKIDVSVVDDLDYKVSVFKNLSTQGTIAFEDKIDYNTGRWPVSVDVVDLDGDLKNDLVVGLFEFDAIDEISLHRNIRTEVGEILLDHSLTIAPQNGRGKTKPGNLDGDEKPDIATIDRVIENKSTGSGDFSLGTPASHSGSHFSIAIADFDNDGKADIVGTNFTQSSITIHRNLIRTPSNEAEILDFSFPEQTSNAIINAVDRTINIEVLYASDLTNLVATFSISDFASLSVNSTIQESGITANDFTSPVTYEVTSEDGNVIAQWVVTVEKAAPSSQTDILSFNIPQQIGGSIISESNNTVDIEVPYGTDVTALVASFELSVGAAATVNGAAQVSGSTTNDFTLAVTYTITAQDGVAATDWIVTVSFAANTETDIVSFVLPEETGDAIIDNIAHIIEIEVGTDTDLTSLTPTIITSFGATVSPPSGATQDFTNNVTYTVTAEDGLTTQDWVVMVSPVLSLTEFDEMNVALYPNPVENELYLNLGEFKTQSVTISITTILGEEVIKQHVNGHQLVQIDVFTLPKGIYTLTVHNGKNPSSSRFIKK